MDAHSSAPLREVWYYALPGRRVAPGRLRAKTILGEPLLIGRAADGGVFALRDVCPHRGMPLSRGRFDGREIECCYHGWRFDEAGRCTAIPSLVDGQAFEPGRIKVQRYPAREVQGNVWVFFGATPDAAPGTIPEIPVLPDIGDRGPALIETTRLEAAIDHAVVGLMDPAHGPFVHSAWWWRSRGSAHAKAKAFEPSPFGFTMVRHAPSSNSNAYKILGGQPETEIAFRLPGVRVEHIRIGRHTVCNLTALTPLDDRTTEITTALYWTLPWLSPLKPVLRPFVRAFLRQDRDVMAMQQVGLAHAPSLLLVDDADTQAKWYYRLKQEYVRARAENRPFANPVKPRTLRWRS
ncbi:MAG: aromatic ring-hydroxylating dioxygenase subunit alpha [Alphaproteobacteria bacterium]|nr:aromatic ring-hydroxylating dioxygenase subunit alpha [Alphaproteobacteria bacterium]